MAKKLLSVWLKTHKKSTSLLSHVYISVTSSSSVDSPLSSRPQPSISPPAQSPHFQMSFAPQTFPLLHDCPSWLHGQGRQKFVKSGEARRSDAQRAEAGSGVLVGAASPPAYQLGMGERRKLLQWGPRPVPIQNRFLCVLIPPETFLAITGTLSPGSVR